MIKKVLGGFCILVLILTSCEDEKVLEPTVDDILCTPIGFEGEYQNDSILEYYQQALDTIEKEFEDGGQYSYSFETSTKDKTKPTTIIDNSRAFDCNNYGQIKTVNADNLDDPSITKYFSIIDDSYTLYNATESNDDLTEITETDSIYTPLEDLTPTFILENINELRSVKTLNSESSTSSEDGAIQSYPITINSKNNGEVDITVTFFFDEEIISFEYSFDDNEYYNVSFLLYDDGVSVISTDYKDLLN